MYGWGRHDAKRVVVYLTFVSNHAMLVLPLAAKHVMTQTRASNYNIMNRDFIIELVYKIFGKLNTSELFYSY